MCKNVLDPWSYRSSISAAGASPPTANVVCAPDARLKQGVGTRGSLLVVRFGYFGVFETFRSFTVFPGLDSEFNSIEVAKCREHLVSTPSTLPLNVHTKNYHMLNFVSVPFLLSRMSPPTGVSKAV